MSPIKQVKPLDRIVKADLKLIRFIPLKERVLPGILFYLSDFKAMNIGASYYRGRLLSYQNLRQWDL